MPEMRKGTRPLAAVAVAAGSLASFPAEAFDRAHCNQMFANANVAKVDTFSINAGRVDFGEDPHLAGAPRGTAVICWHVDGRIHFAGKVYADSLRENVLAIAVIRFRRDGAWAQVRPSVFGNFAASQSVSFTSSFSHFVDRVEVQLFSGSVSGNGPDILLRQRNFIR